MFDPNKPFKFRNKHDLEIVAHCIVDFDPEYPIYILCVNKREKEHFSERFDVNGEPFSFRKHPRQTDYDLINTDEEDKND